MEKEVVDGNIGIDFEKVLWNKNFKIWRSIFRSTPQFSTHDGLSRK